MTQKSSCMSLPADTRLVFSIFVTLKMLGRYHDYNFNFRFGISAVKTWPLVWLKTEILPLSRFSQPLTFWSITLKTGLEQNNLTYNGLKKTFLIHSSRTSKAGRSFCINCVISRKKVRWLAEFRGWALSDLHVLLKNMALSTARPSPSWNNAAI